MRPIRRLLLGVAGAAAVAGALVPSGRAEAHPLGNLTVNSAIDVAVRPDGLAVTYVLDLAELPTVQARQQLAAAGGAEAWAAGRCAKLAAGVRLDGAAPAAAGTPALTFPPGQGGLDTLRLTCPLALARSFGEAPAALAVEDTNDTDRIGWREIVVRGDGVAIVSSDVPTVSPSALLTAYPEGAAALRQLRAAVTTRPGDPGRDPVTGDRGSPQSAGAPAERPQVRGADGLTRRLQEAVADRRLTVSLAAVAMALAFVLGGLHSLAPGHGKTLMAATVLARRGAAARQVLTIGATVAATHTTGVLVLGVAIWTSQSVAPDRVLPWLTLASGGLLVVTGLTLLVRRLRGGPGHHHHGRAFAAHHDAHDHPHHEHHDHPQHDHPHHHDHEHHEHHDHHDHPHHGHGDEREPVGLSRRWLVAMGMAGGMVPTPSALVVLLGAAALGRTWFGVLLVAVYGIGMAATLLAAGVALVRLQGWLERHWYGTRWLTTTLRFAPVVTALALMGGGLALAVRSVSGV